MNYELKIKEILKKVLNIETENLDSSTHLHNTILNSLTFIKLIVLLEEEFDIQFDDDDLDIEKFETIESIIDYIKQLKQE